MEHNFLQAEAQCLDCRSWSPVDMSVPKLDENYVYGQCISTVTSVSFRKKKQFVQRNLKECHAIASGGSTQNVTVYAARRR